jgi:hypothetical protein
VIEKTEGKQIHVEKVIVNMRKDIWKKNMIR